MNIPSAMFVTVAVRTRKEKEINQMLYTCNTLVSSPEPLKEAGDFKLKVCNLM